MKGWTDRQTGGECCRRWHVCPFTSGCHETSHVPYLWAKGFMSSRDFIISPYFTGTRIPENAFNQRFPVRRKLINTNLDKEFTFFLSFCIETVGYIVSTSEITNSKVLKINLVFGNTVIISYKTQVRIFGSTYKVQ